MPGRAIGDKIRAMNPTLHVAVLSAWLGVVLAEVVLELLPLRRPELRRATSVFHFYIDLFVELPVLMAVVATGVLLLGRHPIDTLVVVKVAGGALAVLANLTCVGVVIARHLGPPEAIERRSRLVIATAAVGAPGAAVALYLGARLAGWIA